VPIASATTSYAKICLLKKMYEIGTDNILYWDTDCIVSKVPFNPSCIDDARIGYWKEEAKLSEWICLASKVYWLKQKDTGKTNWIFKGIGAEPLTEQKINPRKLFLDGAEIWQKRSIPYNWGVKIYGTFSEVKPARANPKAELIHDKEEWIWQPFAHDGMSPAKVGITNPLYAPDYVRNH
jgi:hypothetical protein